MEIFIQDLCLNGNNSKYIYRTSKQTSNGWNMDGGQLSTRLYGCWSYDGGDGVGRVKCETVGMGWRTNTSRGREEGEDHVGMIK